MQFQQSSAIIFGQKTFKKIDRFLSILDKPQPEVTIDKEKKFLSKVTILDYFSILEQSYKSSSIQDKTSLLNTYYRELNEKYYGAGNTRGFLFSDVKILSVFFVFFLFCFVFFLSGLFLIENLRMLC